MTDEFSAYKNMLKFGCKRHSVIHSKRRYVRKNIHANTIEGFCGLVQVVYQRDVAPQFHALTYNPGLMSLLFTIIIGILVFLSSIIFYGAWPNSSL